MTFRDDLNLRRGEYIFLWVAIGITFTGYVLTTILVIDMLRPFLVMGLGHLFVAVGLGLALVLGGGLIVSRLLEIGARRGKQPNVTDSIEER